jgi:hypothetical protein
MYLPSLNSIFSARSGYNLKKLCWHTVVLKLFIICFRSIYHGNPKTLEELKSSVEREIFAIPSDILQSMMSNFGMR